MSAYATATAVTVPELLQIAADLSPFALALIAMELGRREIWVWGAAAKREVATRDAQIAALTKERDRFLDLTLESLDATRQIAGKLPDMRPRSR